MMQGFKKSRKPSLAPCNVSIGDSVQYILWPNPEIRRRPARGTSVMSIRSAGIGLCAAVRDPIATLGSLKKAAKIPTSLERERKLARVARARRSTTAACEVQRSSANSRPVREDGCQRIRQFLRALPLPFQQVPKFSASVELKGGQSRFLRMATQGEASS